MDLAGVARQIYSGLTAPMNPFLAIALFYRVVTSVFLFFLKSLERRGVPIWNIDSRPKVLRRIYR